MLVQLLKGTFDLPTVAVGPYYCLGIGGSRFTGKMVNPINIPVACLPPVRSLFFDGDDNGTVVAVAVP